MHRCFVLELKILISPGSQGAITTSGDPNGNWWGTLVSTNGFNPAPWLGCCGKSDPEIIWYWVR